MRRPSLVDYRPLKISHILITGFEMDIPGGPNATGDR